MVLWLLPLLEPPGLLLGTQAAKAGNAMLSRSDFSSLKHFAARVCQVLGIWAHAVLRGCGVPAVPGQVSFERSRDRMATCCAFFYKAFFHEQVPNVQARTTEQNGLCMA